MESAYQDAATHREATDVTQGGLEVRTPSAADHPAAGRHRLMSHRVDASECRGAGSSATDSMIRTFSRLNVPQRAGVLPSEPEPAESGPERSPNGNPGVTTEELTILTLMANGLTLDSVAIRVAMSPRTLSRRLRCVCDRLGVAHPIQAIVWAAHQGLI
jgi:DNA-binding NarL/FixJ family response regulator